MAEDQSPGTENYSLAFRFRGDRSSERAYFRVQELVRQDPAELELSVYRVQRRGDWLVALVGEHPGLEFEQQVRSALSGGTEVTLEDDVLRFLQQRRVTQASQGPWVERHHRPGQGFNFER